MNLKYLTPLLLPLFAGCASLSGDLSPPPALRLSTDYSVRRDIVYTPQSWPAPLQADLYQPKGAGTWPAVLLIYGGNWSAADHRWQMQFIARKLARRGYVVLSAQYRGVPENHFPAPLEDLRQALRWLRRHAAENHIDPAKIAAYGFSAGGHLAELIGTLDGPPEVRVQAVVAASAPSDLTLFGGGDVVAQFLGGTLAEIPDVYRAASPVNHVSADDPPFFLYQGTNDETVSPEHSRVFKAALDRAGVMNKLIWLKGRGHASVLLLGSNAEDAAIDFLDAVLRAPARAGRPAATEVRDGGPM
ncbi:MAG: alpha/beta hydrolase [Opitutaceae bacterium]